jgi:hypothetical protein
MQYLLNKIPTLVGRFSFRGKHLAIVICASSFPSVNLQLEFQMLIPSRAGGSC